MKAITYQEQGEETLGLCKEMEQIINDGVPNMARDEFEALADELDQFNSKFRRRLAEISKKLELGLFA